jgi:hypothetical protein
MIGDGKSISAGHLNIESSTFKSAFDREPFGYTHNLSSLDAFSFESLGRLAQTYSAHPRDYFVSASAPSAGSDFFSVPHGQHPVEDAIKQLDSSRIRILLKRPENHDPRFRRLLNELFAQVVGLRGGLGPEKVVRLESAIFISSASATTPFHFDPEIAFFAQIEGEKIYHMYSPAAVDDRELEDFYLQGAVSIGQLDLAGRDPALEHVFKLNAGFGMHQPQNSPHWVETRDQRSISYSFVFETDATRSAGRVRAFNHYVRKAGFKPGRVGSKSLIEAAKAASMRAIIPARQRAGLLVKSAKRIGRPRMERAVADRPPV